MKFKSLEREVRHHVVCNMKYELCHILIKENLLSPIVRLLCTNMIEFLRRENQYNKTIRDVKSTVIHKMKYINDSPTLAECIMRGDCWFNSLEGFNFWKNIYTYYKLKDIKIK